MSTDIDWQHELDSSFGAGHDVATAHYVAGGRTAVRRRRASTIAIVAAMVVCVGAAWASGTGGAPRGDAPVATQPSAPTTDAQPTMSAREARKARLERMREQAGSVPVRMGNPGTLTYAGLDLAPNAGPVLRMVNNPMDYTSDQGRSLGIRVLVDGKEQYALMTVHPADDSSSMTVMATGDFDGWLAQAVRDRQALDVANGVTASSGDTSDQPWLVLDADGGITTARSSVVIAEQRTSVDLGENFSGDATRTGVVRLLVDGRSEFAAYRVIDGTLDVIPGGGTFDSMTAFINWARDQYASGTGMR